MSLTIDKVSHKQSHIPPLQLRGGLIVVLDLNDQLSSVDTLVQIDKSLLSNLEATTNNSLRLLELTLRNPLSQLSASSGEVLDVVEDDETLHLDTHGDDLGECTGSLGLGGVVLADETAFDEAGVFLCSHETHVEDIATDWIC
jgi:hypothetical protein